MKYFKNVNVELDINKRKVGYGDFRDWFILENKPVHETELILYINDEKVYTNLFPINTNQIVCKVNSEVNKEVYVEFFKWDIPEMGITRINRFPNAMLVTQGDTLNIDLTMELNVVEGD